MRRAHFTYVAALAAGIGLIFLTAIATAPYGWWPAVVLLGFGLLAVVLWAVRTAARPPAAAPTPSDQPATAPKAEPGQPTDERAIVIENAARLAGLIDIRTVYRASAHTMAQALAADKALLYDYDFRERTLRMSEPRGNRQYPLSEQPLLARLLNEGGSHQTLLTDTRTEPEEHALLISQHGSAMLAVPMRINGRPAGLVRLIRTELTPFTPAEARIAEALADQAGLSIQNARAVHQIAESRDRLAAILDTTHDGVMVLDAQGAVSLINPRLEEWWGLRGYRLLKRPLLELWDQADLRLEERLGFTDEEVRELLLTLRAGLALAVPRMEFAVGGSRPRFFERTVTPVLDQLDKAVGWVILLRDITEEKELQQMRESLTHMIVHDLRSPLASIQTGLVFIRDRGSPDGKQSPLIGQAVDLALRAANKLLVMVNTLLDIAKMQTGELELKRRPVPAAGLVAEVLNELGPLAGEQNIALVNAVAEDLPPLDADREQLGRVLTNLVDNALKYSPSGQPVTVRAEPDGDAARVRITILDSGPGIPDEYQARVFERFVQVRGREGRRRGSGLGLSFCKLTVEAHGGEIWVENRPEGGSAFSFTIPVMAGEAHRVTALAGSVAKADNPSYDPQDPH
jgi:PAS domain S-box-containing protein